MSKTKIEWTEHVFNPIVGCSKVSPGCDNCYAEKMAGRLANMPNQIQNYGHVVKWNDEDVHEIRPIGKWSGKTKFIESALDKPLKRKKPTMYFVCSMGDLFHESVPWNWIDRVWNMMSKCPQHTFQILTKRPDQMAKFVSEVGHFNYGALPNVWLGVTAENQTQADGRIPELLKIPAAKRFVSIEPMLGVVDLNNIPLETAWYDDTNAEDIIDWVICGGETGPKARPMHPDWVRSIRDQCVEANVPFFFKSWGEWKPLKKSEFKQYPLAVLQKNQFHGGAYARLGKKKAGHLIDGKEYKEMPK